MSSEKLKKAKAYYNSLKRHSELLSQQCEKRLLGKSITLSLIEDEISSLKNEDIISIPDFKVDNFETQDRKHFWPETLLTYINRVISLLESELSDNIASSLIEYRKFNFVKDSEILNIIERDYEEIQRAIIAQCYKSVIILAGSLIEAILTDTLIQNEKVSLGAKEAPRKKPDIKEWNLNECIKVAVGEEMVSKGVEKLSHSVREYRNLVHPGNEIINKLKFGAEEAKIALEVLHIVHRDLSPEREA